MTSSRAPSKRSSPRPVSSSHPSQPRRRSPPASARSNTCCGRMLSRRSMVIAAALSIVLLTTIAWTCVSREVVVGSGLYTFQIVNEYPHDPAAFTQGLLYVENDTLYESTGLYRQSSVREVHLQSGKVLSLHHMDGSIFAEGLTLLGSRLFQVAWLTRTGFIYDMHNLNPLGRFTHQMQDGWGLATDGRVIFGSDGTSSLYEMDPNTFKVNKKVVVKYEDIEIRYLNELEYIQGEIWANIWQTDCIARISPNDGKVLSWILLHPLRQSLLASGHNGIDVLNGIAWDKVNDRIFVTGKLWPKLYEIKLRPLTGATNLQVKDYCNIN